MTSLLHCLSSNGLQGVLSTVVTQGPMPKETSFQHVFPQLLKQGERTWQILCWPLSFCLEITDITSAHISLAKANEDIVPASERAGRYDLSMGPENKGINNINVTQEVSYLVSRILNESLSFVRWAARAGNSVCSGVWSRVPTLSLTSPRALGRLLNFINSACLSMKRT